MDDSEEGKDASEAPERAPCRKSWSACCLCDICEDGAPNIAAPKSSWGCEIFGSKKGNGCC